MHSKLFFKPILLSIGALALLMNLEGCAGKTIASEEAEQKESVNAAVAPPEDENGDEVNTGEKSDKKKSSAPTPESAPNSSSAGDVSNPLYHRFELARKQNDFTTINQVAGEILSRNPGDVRVLNTLASIAIQQEKYDLARLYCTKVLAKDPNNGAAYNNRGVIELKTDNLRLALEQFKRATEVDGKNKAAHANLGAIYLKYRNYQNAALELQAAVENGDQSPDTLSNLGFALTGIADYKNAEKAYQRALTQESNNLIVSLNYATLMVEKTHKYKEAIRLLNKIRFIAREPAILDKVEILLRKAENPEAKTESSAGSQKGVPE